MTAVRARERLLTADEAGALLGADAARVAFLEDRGFIAPLITARGPAYREGDVAALADAIAPPRRPALITAAQAAYILDVSVPTLRRATRRGLLARDPQGFYDSGEVRALHEARRGRKALRPAPPGEDG